MVIFIHLDESEPFGESCLVSHDLQLLDVSKRLKDALDDVLCDVVVEGANVELLWSLLLHQVLGLSRETILLGHCHLDDDWNSK